MSSSPNSELLNKLQAEGCRVKSSELGEQLILTAGYQDDYDLNSAIYYSVSYFTNTHFKRPNLVVGFPARRLVGVLVAIGDGQFWNSLFSNGWTTLH